MTGGDRESRVIEVRSVDGVPCVVIRSGDEAQYLAALVRWCNDWHARNGKLALPVTSDLVRALRYACTVADILAPVPDTEHNVEGYTGSAEDLVTTADAALVLGISERGVRQRIERGTLRARQAGKQWLIRTDDLRQEAS